MVIDFVGGAPHFGHCLAFELIVSPHSLHVVNAMLFSLPYTRCTYTALTGFYGWLVFFVILRKVLIL